jgi:hypothetical protein
MKSPIKVGDRFKHFKHGGGYYTVASLFTWEPTKEESVEYENDITKERWGRPLRVFLEEVADPATGQPVARFKKVTDSQGALPLYALEEKTDERGQPYWLVYHYSGDVIATLKDGYAAVIILSFSNMIRQGQRGNDYMAGVMAGCTHMHMLQENTESTNKSPAP